MTSHASGTRHARSLRKPIAHSDTSTTGAKAPEPAALERVYGHGSSSTVTYGGTGIYFLDKVRPGTWRLEVYPDAVPIRDPFELPSEDDEIGPGSAFLVYVFDDDINDGTPDGFPKTLESTGTWLPLDGNFEYDGLFYDPDQGPEGDSHFLLANPHPVPLDFCEFDAANVASSADFWDPAAGGGNGDYLNLNCAGGGDVHIAAFQGFWVRTLDVDPGAPELGIPEEAYLSGSVPGYFKERSALSGKDIADREQSKTPGHSSVHGEWTDEVLVNLTVQSDDDVFTNTVNILFSGQGTFGMDRYDAPKLSPAGLATRWLSFHALDEQGRAYAFRSLPALGEGGEHPSPRGEISIPLDVETTEAGWFEMSWVLPEGFTGSAVLRDSYTNRVVDLAPGGSYRFEVDDGVEPSGGFKTPEGSGALYSSVRGERTDGEPRFILTVSAGQTSSALPAAVALLPNYPNPFNPVTEIRFELPQASQVSLEVYDILGRRVATLVEGTVAAGVQTATFDARRLASGVYITRLQVADGPAGPVVQVQKMTLVRRE